MTEIEVVLSQRGGTYHVPGPKAMRPYAKARVNPNPVKPMREPGPTDSKWYVDWYKDRHGWEDYIERYEVKREVQMSLCGTAVLRPNRYAPMIGARHDPGGKLYGFNSRTAVFDDEGNTKDWCCSACALIMKERLLGRAH